MFFWLVFAFCFFGALYGIWAIIRDVGRGRVQGRGFGFDRASQPAGYFALMTFNGIVVVLLSAGALYMGVGLLRRMLSS